MAWQQILQTSADAELDFFFGGIEVNEFRQLQILSVELFTTNFGVVQF